MSWTPTEEEIRAWAERDGLPREPRSFEEPDPLHRLGRDAESVIVNTLALAAELPFLLLTRLLGPQAPNNVRDGGRRVPFFEEDL